MFVLVNNNNNNSNILFYGVYVPELFVMLHIHSANPIFKKLNEDL